MTARTRKKPLHMPPIACSLAGCGEEYEPIGDYRETYDAAELGGWRYRIFGEMTWPDGRTEPIGEWLGPLHKDVLPWWPGRTRPALPARDPGATTRTAEVTGVVPASVSWSTAALPAAEPPLEPLPEDVSRPGSEDNWANPAGPGHPVVPGSETDTGGRAEPERGPGHPDHGPQFVALEQWVADQDSEATGD